MKFAIRSLLSASIVFILFLYSCEKNDIDIDNTGDFLLSTDTLSFDTIITTYRTPTQNFRIINKSFSPLEIKTIRLAGGEESHFRLNVDGIPCKSINDIEILSRDSIFIFVEATFPEFSIDSVCYRLDSIIIESNTGMQSVKLLSWSQDVTFLRNEWLNTQTWNSKKPYLVYDSVMVDEGQTLTIEKGCKVFFHNNAKMYVLGNIIVKGTKDEPVIFMNDRFDENAAGDSYEDIPGQWYGIYVLPSTLESLFNHAEIKNSILGLWTGSLGDPVLPSVKVTNSIIKNHSFSGLISFGANIDCYNTIFSNSRTCIFLCHTGKYTFNHITISNNFNYQYPRQTGSVIIKDYYIDDVSKYVGEFESIFFGNSIIFGDRNNEFEVFKYDISNPKVPCTLDHCMMKLGSPDSLLFKIDYTDLLFEETLKFDSVYNYLPDTTSAFIDKGSINIGMMFPEDLFGNNRLTDGIPDLGAVEFIKK